MDLREDVQTLLDEDQADMMKAAPCLLAVSTEEKVKAKTRERKGQKRKQKGVWLRVWRMKRHIYGMSDNLIKHL